MIQRVIRPYLKLLRLPDMALSKTPSLLAVWNLSRRNKQLQNILKNRVDELQRLPINSVIDQSPVRDIGAVLYQSTTMKIMIHISSLKKSCQ